MHEGFECIKYFVIFKQLVISVTNFMFVYIFTYYLFFNSLQWTWRCKTSRLCKVNFGLLSVISKDYSLFYSKKCSIFRRKDPNSKQRWWVLCIVENLENYKIMRKTRIRFRCILTKLSKELFIKMIQIKGRKLDIVKLIYANIAKICFSYLKWQLRFYNSYLFKGNQLINGQPLIGLNVWKNCVRGGFNKMSQGKVQDYF